MEKRFTDYLKLSEGYKILPSIDRDRYPEIDGLEGPFSTLSGAVVYYDPKEGKYYDKDKDMYLSYDEFRDLDNDYSNMRDERDEVKEDASSDNMIYIGYPSDYMDDVWKHEVYIDGNLVTDGENFELDGKSFDSVDGFVRALSKKFDVPVDSFDLYALDEDGKNPELQDKNFIPRAGIDEGNEFAHELKKARDSGKDEFEVDGKKYPVKENHEDGAVGYVELFFTDRDGGERSQEVEVTMVDGKLEVTMGMPGPEDDMYWDDADIEEQLEDALRRGEVEWMNESADLSRIKQLAGIKVDEGRMKDSVIHDSETMSKKEFAKKHGKELADEYFESVEISEGEDFGMFSSEANDIVRNIIQHILNKIEDGKMEAGEAEDALMRDLEEMSEEEKYSEAMDTEVREKALIYMNKGIARLKARDDGDIDRLRQLAGIRETSDSSEDYDRGGKDAYYGRPRKTGQSDEYNRGYDEQPFGEKDY